MLSSVFDALAKPGAKRGIHVTEVFADRYEGDPAGLVSRLQQATADFPALEDAEVVVTRDDPDADRLGRAIPHARVICLPVDRPADNVTLYHEVGHIAIQVRAERGEDLPTTSEEFCSIWSMAKMPPDAVDDRRIPYLTTPVLDTELFPEVCRQALQYREDHQDYVQQCNRWLNGGWHSRDERYRQGGDGDAE